MISAETTSGIGGGEIKENNRVNWTILFLIHCKYHNVSLPSKTIKKQKREF
jgi:hypothetical protein